MQMLRVRKHRSDQSLGSVHGGSVRAFSNSVSKRGNEVLVLSRKVGESVLIFDDIEVVVVEIKGDKVRLGFIAPKSVPIHRREVYQAIQRKGGIDDKVPAA